MVTAKMIVANLRSELNLNKPDQRALGLMIADALEMIDQRVDGLERQPQGEPEVRQADAPEIRGRKRK